MATACGIELLYHHVQLLLEGRPDYIVLKTDVKNAFNSLHRHHLLEQVSNFHPEIYPHVRQMYSHSSSLVYQQGDCIVIIPFEEGIHQGDPLGPALFSTGIHSVLSDLKGSFPTVRVLAYLDDIFLVGEKDDVLSSLDYLRPAFSNIGLQISSSKCEIYSPSGPLMSGRSDLDAIPVVSDGTIVLGAPIGKREYVSAASSQYAESGRLLCEQLMKLGEVQSAMLLLRFCHVPRMNHLARLVCPDRLQAAAEVHDKISRETFTHVLGYSHLTDSSWMQATLPVRFGGFSMSPCLSTSRFAFLSSWVHTLVHLPIRYPDLKSALDLLVNSNGVEESIAFSLMQAGSDGTDITEMIQVPTKLQQRLTRQHAKEKTSAMIEKAPSQRDAARLRSIQGKGAGAWLNAMPTSNKLALVSRDFRLAACLRLGLAMPFDGCIRQCDCGSFLDSCGYHLLTCKWGGGPVWTHECIANVWSDCLRSLQMHHHREPRHRYITSDNRPDITVFDVGSGSNTDLDISLAHPWSSEVISASASTEGAAASRREQKKTEKYSRERLLGKETVTAVPLVLEHFGRWGQQAEMYLQHLSSRSTDAYGTTNASSFKTHWRERMSIQLQKANARVIYRKVERLLDDAS